MHYQLGEALTERMRTFFPVIVHSTEGGDARDCIDIFWVDREAKILDQHLLQAILNGQEVETSPNATGVDFNKSAHE